MTARLQDIELCAECKSAVQHRRGPICENITMTHTDPRYSPIRFCLGCFFAYRRKYEAEGWTAGERVKITEQ